MAQATITSVGGIAATGVAVSGYELDALSNSSLATFTDAGGSLSAGDFAAAIDWGDGTSSAGSVGSASGTYMVSGSHEYLDEGRYTVSVNVQQTTGPVSGAASAAVSATATIHEQLLANGSVGTPDQNYIQEIYRDLFDRAAEPSGLAFWVARLEGGESRARVALEMVELATPEEFQRDTGYGPRLGAGPDKLAAGVEGQMVAVHLSFGGESDTVPPPEPVPDQPSSASAVWRSIRTASPLPMEQLRGRSLHAVSEARSRSVRRNQLGGVSLQWRHDREHVAGAGQPTPPTPYSVPQPRRH